MNSIADKTMKELIIMTMYATDKQSLQKAYDSKADEIIITGKLAKKFKKASSLKKVTPAALALAGGTIAALIPTIIAATATAPASAGISYFIAIPAIAAEAGTVATTLSVSTAEAIGIIMLASSISLTLLISISKGYDIEIGALGTNVKLRKKN